MKNFTNAEVYIVAELSANHDGSIERAKKIITAAAESGADAIKIQTYTPDTITLNCENEYFKINGTIWNGQYLYDLYKQAYMPWEWTQELQAYALSLGLDFFSTPFDDTSVDFLESLNVPLYKIASFELIDIPLLKKVASTQKPVILSTGMATLAEIDEAVQTLRDNGTSELVLLKCTSSYPAPPEEANLKTIPHMAQAFNCQVGLSDHTLGSSVAVAAVALGAKVIEKHFTLSRDGGGPDDSFSMEPSEFKEMVQSIRIVEKALGKINYSLTDKERISQKHRKSLFVAEDIKKGEVFTNKNIRSVRPGFGLHPRYLEKVLGLTAKKDYKKGEPFYFDL